ncbi:MAG: hypothetical protein R2726_05140 [Acidimicrobiales bacterium]
MVLALPLVLAQAEEPASGMPWWAYVIWGWLFVSLAVYAYRLWRRFVGKTDAADRRATPATLPPSTPTGPSPTEALFLEAKAKQQAGTDAAPGSETPGDEGAPVGEGERRGLFAASDAPVAPARPVPELLEGIAMPCDLVPVTDEAAVDASFHRVAFHTRSAPPGTVGRELGDALERLGYSLRSTSDTEVVARRGDDVLRVTLHPRADGAQRDGKPAYPSIPPGDVVVEINS